MTTSPRQTCEWCGRITTSFRRLPDGTHECRYERKCIAQRRPTQGLLTQMGTPALVELLEQHGGCVKLAALAIGVASKNLRGYFKQHAPAEWVQLRERFPPVHRGGRKPKISSAAEVTRRLERYEGSITRAAVSFEVHRWTLSKTIRRLAPGVLAERSRPEAATKRRSDPALHPWRRQWARRVAA